MATVVLERVSKIFRGGAYGARAVDFSIADGEFVCLVGPSGCGKSTTLNLIAGLEAPTSGRVLIAGEDVTHKDPGARDVAMVFQSYALYPHLDVRGNIAFPLKVARVPREEAEARVREAAAILGLESLLERKPRELSGGQRQRVALGRALVRRPKAFLFDEPLSNLDANLRVEMRGEIKKLHERLRATFIYVTHDQAEAMMLADRVVVMKDGAVQQIGSPAEVYERPRSIFVATFFGAPRINLIPREGKTAAVRPEHVEVGFGEAPERALCGRVWLVEPLGADTWVTVDTEVGRITARLSGDLRPNVGARAWLRWDERRIRWFDRSSF
jgi:multiple sugar transport system ATP-binding protein